MASHYLVGHVEYIYIYIHIYDYNVSAGADINAKGWRRKFLSGGATDNISDDDCAMNGCPTFLVDI